MDYYKSNFLSSSYHYFDCMPSIFMKFIFDQDVKYRVSLVWHLIALGIEDTSILSALNLFLLRSKLEFCLEGPY